MKKVIPIIFYLMLLVSCISAVELPSPPFDQAVADRLLENHTIYFPVAGCVTGDFVKAYNVLESTNVLDQIHAAYAALLPEGEKPDFIMHSITNGRHYCINKNNERSNIYDMSRRGGVDTNFFERVMYVQGERPFGKFESLIIMQILHAEGAAPNELMYNAKVHVYPHCMAVRLFLKYCPGVKRHFRKETYVFERVMTSVLNSLLAPDSSSPQDAGLAEL